jgi:hypothetical protein
MDGASLAGLDLVFICGIGFHPPFTTAWLKPAIVAASLYNHLSFCVLTLVVMGCVLRMPNILGISILSQALSYDLRTLYCVYIAFSLRHL